MTWALYYPMCPTCGFGGFLSESRSNSFHHLTLATSPTQEVDKSRRVIATGADVRTSDLCFTSTCLLDLNRIPAAST